MADSQRTGLKGLETDSYFTSQASGTTTRPAASRPGFERQNTAPLRTQLSTIRSPSSPGPVSPGAPRTPIFNRSISSPFASPRADFSASDETLVLELGSRYLRIGIGGEKRPRCIANFGPSTQRRAGDYTGRPQEDRNAIAPTQETWGNNHELWQMNLRNLDLGLVRDKIERAVRDAMTQHVLILDDTRKRSQIVAVPSLFPQPLLTTVLEALFNHSPSPPSICLVTMPVLSLVSAGLRTGLVIDIGWTATIITAVYEYREIKHAESTRAMKAVHWELASLLERRALGQTTSTLATEANAQPRPRSFEETEDILYHLAWCASEPPTSGTDQTLATSSTAGRLVTLPVPSSPSAKTMQIPFSDLSQPAELGLFATHIPDPDHTLDDDDFPISLLAYRTLLALPLDVRSQLISRIVITGGGANLPGLKARLLSDISRLVKDKEWDQVHNYGSIEAKVKSRRTKLKTVGPVAVASESAEQSAGVANKDFDPDTMTPTHLQSPLPDPILTSIQSRVAIGPNRNDVGSTRIGVRGVETLGAWAGASLMAGLRVKGAVEIERERFLQHGLLGPMEREEDAKHKRQSVMPGQGPQAKPGDRHSGNWTLGVFG